jgi:hypothetical protein
MSEIRPTMARGKPRGMEVARLGSRAQREFIESEAIDIFTAMTNGGCTFQQALGAVFLSGMNLAHTLRERA